MNYSIVFDQVDDGSLPDGFFYAHVPALGLTTHGKGLDGARAAAVDLLTLWIAEKRANGEPVVQEREAYFSRVEVLDAVVGA